MYYTTQDAEQFTIEGGTVGRLYPADPNNAQSIAYIEMDGQYPVEGYSINEFCTETLYILEGEFIEEVDGKEYILKPGDVLMVLPGQKYKSRGTGKALVFITPGWEKSQNSIITE